MRKGFTDHIVTSLPGHLDPNPAFWGSDHKAFIINIKIAENKADKKKSLQVIPNKNNIVAMNLKLNERIPDSFRDLSNTIKF